MSKVYGILTDNILKMIDAGVAPWRRPWDASRGRSMRPVSITGTMYRGINYIMLSTIASMNGWTNIWLTGKMIRERGGSLKEGQEKNASPLYFYKVIEKDDDSTFPVFRFWPVYNLSQVDGIIVKGVNDGTENAETNMPILAAPQSIVDGYQNAPAIRHNGDPRAYYVPVTDIVNMPDRNTFDTAEHYYATLFHELAHSTGHVSRLNRKDLMDNHGFGSHAYSLEELTAELTSVFLCNECGINNDPMMENAANYLADWHKKLKSDPKMFAIAASRAQKAADLILGKKDNETENEEKE